MRSDHLLVSEALLVEGRQNDSASFLEAVEMTLGGGNPLGLRHI